MEKEIASQKSRKLLLYEPYEKQKFFHSSLCTTRAIFGGNRSGKTTSGGIEFLYHATGIYPDWYPEASRFHGPIIGRIIAKDFQKGIGEVIIPFLEEWLDPAFVAKKYRNPLGIAVKWTLKNGSVFDIMTHEQTTEQFEGWRGHIAWFDEPPPRDKYVATIRGLVDFKGRNWLTLTPLTQPWIYDQIYTQADNKRIFVTTVDIRDNPYLDEAAIHEFESGLTEEEKEARLHGKFMHLSGLVYKEFNPDVNICAPFEIPHDWTRFFAIDPHERKATVCVWLAADPNDGLWLYDELSIDLTLEEIARAILSQEGDNPPQIRLIDPHMDKENVIAGGFNVRRELMKYGIFCQRGNSDPALGKSRIRLALRPQFNKLSKRMEPQLKIFSNCYKTIYEFQHYQWDDYKRNKEEYGLKEQVKKKYDDAMDALRYIFNYGPRYIKKESFDDAEPKFTGEYTKYPVKPSNEESKYHSLVDREAA